MTSFDYSELDKLVADLGAVPERVQGNVRKAVEVSARKVKDDWRAPLLQSEYLPRGAFTVSYDVEVTSDGVAAEVGPTVRGKGSHWLGGLVGLLEFGTPRTPPTGYGHEALRRNQADFERGLGIAMGDVL